MVETPIAALPAWERLYRAAQAGLHRPDTEARVGREVLALLTRDNLVTLCLVVSVSLAATLTANPVMLGVDAALAAVGFVTLGRRFLAMSKPLYHFGRAAWSAQTEDDLQTSGGYFVEAVILAGPAVLTGLLGHPAFRRAQGSAKAIVPGAYEVLGPGPSGGPTLGAPPPPSLRASTGQVKSSSGRSWPLMGGIAAVLLLLTVLIVAGVRAEKVPVT